MKNLAKLVLATCISVGLLISSQPSFAAQDKNKIEKIKTKMVSLGLSKEIVNDLPESEILKYENVTEIKKNKKHFEFKKVKTKDNKVSYSKAEISESDYLKAKKTTKQTTISTRSSATPPVSGNNDEDDCDWLKLESWIAKGGAKYKGNSDYFLSARYEWKYKPEIRWTDLFGIGYTNASPYRDTTYFIAKHDRVDFYVPKPFEKPKQDIKWPSGTGDTSSFGAVKPYETKVTKKTGGPGICFEYKFPKDKFPFYGQKGWFYKYENFRGYMSYDIKLIVASNTSFETHASYLHKEISVGIDPTLTFDIAGVLGWVGATTIYDEAYVPLTCVVK